MTLNISARLHPRLLTAPDPTIRTWILLHLMAAKGGQPMTTTAQELSTIARPHRQIGARAISSAIRELESYGLISTRKKGHAMVISILDVAREAAA